MVNYQHILSLDLKHDYFNDGWGKDLILLPTLETRAKIKGHRLISKERTTGLDLYAPLAANGDLIIPIDLDTTLEWKVLAQSPSFFDITAFPSIPQGKCLFYSNDIPANQTWDQDFPILCEGADFFPHSLIDKSLATSPENSRQLLMHLELVLKGISKPSEGHSDLPMKFSLVFKSKKYVWNYLVTTRLGFDFQENTNWSLNKGENEISSLNLIHEPKNIGPHVQKIWQKLETRLIDHEQVFLFSSSINLELKEEKETELTISKKEEANNFREVVYEGLTSPSPYKKGFTLLRNLKKANEN